MQLIMKTEFDNLRLNQEHTYDSDTYDSDTNGDKQVVKIYCGEKLIAKKLKQKKSIRFFGIKEYANYLTPEDSLG